MNPLYHIMAIRIPSAVAIYSLPAHTHEPWLPLIQSTFISCNERQGQLMVRQVYSVLLLFIIRAAASVS